MAYTNEKGHMTRVKTQRWLYEQERTESWITRNALQAQLNAFHINNSSYKSKAWGVWEIISLFKTKKKKTLFANSETQMVFVAKNIFIIKAGYNKKIQDSVIDYKWWNSTPECIWRVCESERERERAGAGPSSALGMQSELIGWFPDIVWSHLVK